MFHLFPQPRQRSPQAIALPDGDLSLVPHFYATHEADALFQQLLKELNWQQELATVYGKQYQVPRLSAWYADAGVDYQYSGVLHHAQPWTETLQQIKQDIEQHTQLRFNSLLANLYRNGLDKVGWHADNEPELGPNPYIASLSLGATRRFDLRHNTLPSASLHIDLHHGSLLLMKGALQHFWQHQIPQQKRVSQPRINLTFRLTKPVEGH